MCQHEIKVCGRCSVPFECKVGNIALCQCSGISLTDEDKRYIAASYSDCLCRNCLLAIKNEVKHEPVRQKMERAQALLKGR